MNPAARTLIATKDDIRAKRIANSASEGVEYLYDVRLIEDNFGPKGMYSFSGRYLDFEQYITFT